MFMCEIRHLFPFSPLSSMAFAIEFNGKNGDFGLPVAKKLIR